PTPGVAVWDRGVAGPGHAGCQPGVAINPDALAQLQVPSAGRRFDLSYHPAPLYHLQAVDREDRGDLCLELDDDPARRQTHRDPDRRPFDRKRKQRSTRQKSAAGRQVAAPGVVGELLVGRYVHVGAVEPDGNVARHLVRAAHKRHSVATVQVAVVLEVTV